MYQINNWMITYTIGDAFNGWYWIGDSSKEESNSTAFPIIVGLACGWILNLNIYCGIDTDTPTEKGVTN